MRLAETTSRTSSTSAAPCSRAKTPGTVPPAQPLPLCEAATAFRHALRFFGMVVANPFCVVGKSVALRLCAVAISAVLRANNPAAHPGGGAAHSGAGNLHFVLPTRSAEFLRRHTSTPLMRAPAVCSVLFAQAPILRVRGAAGDGAWLSGVCTANPAGIGRV